ncbi:MAG TPA: hypothetical protein VMZ71_07650 [Gemmataceae bacterium]|nr:hypothetical protein [Gemmataceae bacterium]
MSDRPTLDYWSPGPPTRLNEPPPRGLAAIARGFVLAFAVLLIAIASAFVRLVVG